MMLIVAAIRALIGLVVDLLTWQYDAGYSDLTTVLVFPAAIVFVIAITAFCRRLKEVFFPSQAWKTQAFRYHLRLMRENANQ